MVGTLLKLYNIALSFVDDFKPLQMQLTSNK